MPVYRYETLGPGGRSKGYVTADTPSQGRSLLRGRGLRISRFEISHGAKKKGLSWTLPGMKKASLQEGVDEFTRYLALLLRTGVDLAEALNILLRQVPKTIEPVLRRVSECVNAGADLGQALAEEGSVFDPTYIGIVRVGQASGMIDQCLERLVQLRRRRRLLRQQLYSALAYPITVGVVGVGVVLFLMTFVIPKIADVLQQTGRALPFPTRILVFMSRFIIEYGWLVFLLILAGILFIHISDRKKTVQMWLRQQALKVPVLGALLMKAGIAQTTAMLETMLQSGMPLDESLLIVRNTTNNVLLKKEFDHMAEALRSGRTMSDSSSRKGVFPPAVVHMLAVGEETGQLEDVLSELSQFYDSEVEIASRRAVSILEPILIVIMSCIVGFIVLATVLPILRVSGSL